MKRKYSRIVTDPLYIKCKKVIESCETPEQLLVAQKYIFLADDVIRNKRQINRICDIDYIYDVEYYINLLHTECFEKLKCLQSI